MVPRRDLPTYLAGRSNIACASGGCVRRRRHGNLRGEHENRRHSNSRSSQASDDENLALPPIAQTDVALGCVRDHTVGNHRIDPNAALQAPGGLEAALSAPTLLPTPVGRALQQVERQQGASVERRAGDRHPLQEAGATGGGRPLQTGSGRPSSSVKKRTGVCAAVPVPFEKLVTAGHLSAAALQSARLLVGAPFWRALRCAIEHPSASLFLVRLLTSCMRVSAIVPCSLPVVPSVLFSRRQQATDNSCFAPNPHPQEPVHKSCAHLPEVVAAYAAEVTQPMDFRTVVERAAAGAYAARHELQTDVRLVR